MSTINDIAQQYVRFCQQGRFDACLELFSEDAVSVEAWAPPGRDRTTTGLAGIRAKGEAWVRDHEIHSVEVSGPFPLDQRFAVVFRLDVTNKPSQRRHTMEEVALLTVEDGKITREEFFYSVG